MFVVFVFEVSVHCDGLSLVDSASFGLVSTVSASPSMPPPKVVFLCVAYF